MGVNASTRSRCAEALPGMVRGVMRDEIRATSRTREGHNANRRVKPAGSASTEKGTVMSGSLDFSGVPPGRSATRVDMAGWRSSESSLAS